MCVSSNKKIGETREKNSLRNSWSPLPVAACKRDLLYGYESWKNCWTLDSKDVSRADCGFRRVDPPGWKPVILLRAPLTKTSVFLFSILCLRNPMHFNENLFSWRFSGSLCLEYSLGQALAFIKTLLWSGLAPARYGLVPVRC